MIRTQIYLTEEERSGLATLAKESGKNLAELVREAVDRLIEPANDDRRKAVIREAAGLWKDRKDLPDFRALRRSWERK